MATGVRNITVRFGGTAAGLAQASRQGESAMSRFAANARRAAKVATVAFAAAAVAYGKSAIDVASDTNEALSKTRTIFGQQAAAVEAFAAASAKSHGMSRLEALKYVSAMGAVQVAQGASRQQAAALGLQYTRLAADMASFSNTSTEEAAAALQSSMTGEFEQLKKYGIAINDARLSTEAQRIGMEKSGSTWTAAQKQLLSYNLIMADTRVQQGDFARTADGAANSAKILAAQMENLQGAIGAKLLPVQIQFLQAMIGAVDWVTENERSIRSWMNVLGPAALIMGSVVVAMKAYAAIGAVAAFVTGGWTAMFWALNAAMTANPVGIIVAAVLVLGTAFAIAWKKSETFRNIVIGAFNKIVGAVGAAIKGIVTFFGWYADTVLLGFQKILAGLGHLPDWLGGGKAQAAAEAIGRLRDEIAAGVDAINAEIDRIVDSIQINATISLQQTWDVSRVGQAGAAQNEAAADKAFQRANVDVANAAKKALAVSIAKAPTFSASSGGGGGGGGGGGAAPKAVKAAKKTGQEILDAFMSGLASRFPNVETRLQKFSDTVPVRLGHGLDKIVRNAEKGMAALQKKLDVLAGSGNGSIDAARQKLDDAKKASADFAASVRSSIRGLSDLGTHGGGTFEVIRDRLAQSLVNAKQFQATMTALSKAGLSDRAVQELIAQGPGLATQTGQAILAGGKAGIAQINAIQAQIDSVANKTATEQASRFFSAGVRQAEGVLAGLRSKDAELKKQMRELGNALVGAVRDGLNLSVTPAGLKVAGARAAGGPVTGGRSYLVGENGPELFTPRSSGMVAANGGGGMSVNIIATGPTLNDIVEVKIRQANRVTKQAVLAGARRT